LKANRNNYEIIITETKSRHWKKVAFDSTINGNTNISDKNSYILEHSPIRTEEYCIEMKNIPTFVSVHMIRHKIACEHFVQSMRNDRGGNDKEDRWTPVLHTMFLNAEALINIARKRLCNASHEETIYIMKMIKQEVIRKNHDLGQMLVPNCVYRNGLCKEIHKPCGQKNKIMKEYAYYKELFK
jgi:hypothetical protein